ncbi:MAG: sulfatase-like hydrolase/transferase, partial [Oscillospiraceae bacterium]|nr:sulfatase-like hydrolase/transferase [Oscillospiraceae bacterium]
MPAKPNILYLMCDQLRHDCVAALGNPRISTPNLDRLVRRGASFTNAYTPAPVCVAARYSVRTGRDPHTTCSFSNRPPRALGGLPESMEGRCGPYLARRLRELGYRTYGVGKFHTTPDGGEDLGYDVTLRTEEIYGTPEERSRDAYGSFLMGSHPEYAHVEQPHGERTEMYYVPQTAALPKELTVESFVADEVVGLINEPDPLGRPWFAFASFIGPHPPCAP